MGMKVIIRLARAEDIASLQKLEQKHHQEELGDADVGKQGQVFSQSDLRELVENHWILLAEVDCRIIGYVIAGRWQFFESWPIYRHLLKQLPNVGLKRQQTCQYGPIWIDSDYRGQGVFGLLVEKLKLQLQGEFQYMCTFIAEDNQRSYAAHTKKADMQVLDFFDFHGQGYYLLSSKLI